jgi:hypothetical protein
MFDKRSPIIATSQIRNPLQIRYRGTAHAAPGFVPPCFAATHSELIAPPCRETLTTANSSPRTREPPKSSATLPRELGSPPKVPQLFPENSGAPQKFRNSSARTREPTQSSATLRTRTREPPKSSATLQARTREPPQGSKTLRARTREPPKVQKLLGGSPPGFFSRRNRRRAENF